MRALTSSRRPIILGTAVTCLFVVPVGLNASSEAVAETGNPEFSQEQIIVELTPGANIAAALGGGSERLIGNWRTVSIPEGKLPEEILRELSGRPGVERVELDYVVELDPMERTEDPQSFAAVAVDDPFVDYQWHLPAVQADVAWADSTGEGVTVAVVDTGVSRGGEDLDCQTFVAPYNAITGTPGEAAAADDEGHGTHVAGTIAQCTNNGIGVAGVSFDAALMPVKVLDSTGSGLMSWVASGVEWARTHGADVINLSLGCSSCSSTPLNEAIEAAVDDGVVVVAASGNDNDSSVFYPASLPDVIAVGATGFDNTRAPYSNRGSALDLVAPGGNLNQDLNGDGFADGVLQETFTAGSGWGYYFLQGTSMATPHVSGAAAILKSIAPGLDGDGVRSVLSQTSIDLGPPGFDVQYGNGLIQIANALTYLDSPDNTPPAWGSGAKLGYELIGQNAVRLTWPKASDDLAVAGYRVYIDGVLRATKTGTTHLADNLASAEEYRFQVRAFDLAGNTSAPLSLILTTPDSEAPKWDSSAELVVAEYGESRLKLAWDSAHDDVAVAAYRIGVNGTSGIATVQHQATLSGLLPGSSYIVEVVARDAAGNWSDPLRGVVRTARAFRDTSGTTFYEDILWMSGQDITRGCNPPVNDRFCPDEPVTRGQMAAFMVRMLGLEDDLHGGFVDVPKSSTFAADIGKLATAGITRGCDPPVNDRFCPNDPVTRGQIAAFFRRSQVG